MDYFSDYPAGTTLQIMIADSFEVGEDPMDEISTAASRVGVSFSRYITDGENGEIITLW